jgi:hypothetical protein
MEKMKHLRLLDDMESNHCALEEQWGSYRMHHLLRPSKSMPTLISSLTTLRGALLAGTELGWKMASFHSSQMMISLWVLPLELLGPLTKQDR